MKQFLKKYWFYIALTVVFICGMVERIPLLGLISGDMENFLLPWVEELGETGLAGYTGDYNVVYVSILNIIAHLGVDPMFAIKTVSMIFDVVLAVVAMLITREILRRAQRPKSEKKIYELLTFMMVFLWPTVIINSSLWGQCDSIYSSFCLIAILMLLKKKWNWMMIMIGVAISFKLQATFILPFIVVYWFTTRFKDGFSLREIFSAKSDKRSFSSWKFLIIPCAFFVMCIPGVVAGWSVERVFTTYLFQAGEYASRLSSGYPSIYFLFQIFVPEALVPTVRKIGLVVCFTVLVLIGWWLHAKKVKWNGKLVLMVAIGLLLVEAFLFPQMMGRYTYLAGALMLIYLTIYQRNLWIAIEQILVLCTYMSDLLLAVVPFFAPPILGVVIVMWWKRIGEEIGGVRKKKIRKKLKMPGKNQT